MSAPDPIVHAPVRLELLTILKSAKHADFVYLLHETGQTKGNLAAHLAKLEAAQYISVEKTYRGRVPLTRYRLTDTGRAALETYRHYLLGVLGALAPDPN